VAAADASNLPFADDTFDIVLSAETSEHILDRGKMVAEMKRVARKYVVVTTPVSQSADEHEPDFEQHYEGHVNDFDEATVRGCSALGLSSAASVAMPRSRCSRASRATCPRAAATPFRTSTTGPPSTWATRIAASSRYATATG
jgi:hypothetical protein